MKKKKVSKKRVGKKMNCKIDSCNSSCSGFGYFVGAIGTAVYFISSTTGFWNGVLGLLKALVWPAFLVFEVLKYVVA